MNTYAGNVEPLHWFFCEIFPEVDDISQDTPGTANQEPESHDDPPGLADRHQQGEDEQHQGGGSSYLNKPCSLPEEEHYQLT